jgi:hypothetical protein
MHNRSATAGRNHRKPRNRVGGGNPKFDRRPRMDHTPAPALDIIPLSPIPDVDTFDELGVPAKLSAELTKAGITKPFPIQAVTLPDALAGRDVLGRAQTGSGKTLAFGLALLSRLDGGKARPKYPRAIVLVPTRELAMQVSDALSPLARSLNLWCRTVVGGMSFTKQADQLRRGVDLLIATPGHLRARRGAVHRTGRGGPDGGHGLHAAGPRDPRPHPRRPAHAVLGHSGR